MISQVDYYYYYFETILESGDRSTHGSHVNYLWWGVPYNRDIPLMFPGYIWGLFLRLKPQKKEKRKGALECFSCNFD